MAPAEGYWGKQTSTVDWCEENYVVSYYVAEFWNTLSNAAIVLPALNMFLLGCKENHEKRFVHCFFAMTAVGAGSWLFHMTLRYSMQLMDEVPMLWASTCFLYVALMMKSKANEDSVVLQLGLLCLCTVITVMYIVVEVPEFLQISYALLNAFVVFVLIKMIMTMECDKRVFMMAVGCYTLGFMLWIVDNVYCHHLQSIRKQMLADYSGMLFQCHAWWHVFSGFGAYIGCLFTLHTRYLYLLKKPQLKFLLGCLPYVSIPESEKLK